jgi:cytochrome c
MLRTALVLCALGLSSFSDRAAAAADSVRGEHFFRACAACHSLTPNHNMTGPSLAGVIGRKAGTVASFQRYSPALKSSDVVWNDGTLDAWLAKPSGFITGSTMTFEGIDQAAIRADIIAYLKRAMTSVPRNLRFKTDSSIIGPEKGAPAIAGAGMQGDRASVIFSTPEEIGQFIKRKC